MAELQRLGEHAKFRRGIYWFSNDLRVGDNPGLACAAEQFEQLLCVYVVDPGWFKPNRYGLKTMGKHRSLFLFETLEELNRSLNELGQELYLVYDTAIDAIAKLIAQFDIDAIFRSQNAGFYEQKQWRLLSKRFRMLCFQEFASHTLFTESSLPFTLNDLPSSFSKFRKLVETLPLDAKLAKVRALPRTPAVSRLRIFGTRSIGLDELRSYLSATWLGCSNAKFKGGQAQGEKHVEHYFQARFASSYKLTRNELEGWSCSTKFSPWLANGSVSVKYILEALSDYESRVEANESTYWIRFELLWREYFQWVAHAHSKNLFMLGGIHRKNTLTSYYPSRFQSWCHGETPYALVNAGMKELKATGYMSNRTRQVVASCFVNELALDWRYGAAYFEQELIDYDVASNWGNWQYLAGIGMDPRGKRHFDIDKQKANYDANSSFINKWSGSSKISRIDSVDAADWPIV